MLITGFASLSNMAFFLSFTPITYQNIKIVAAVDATIWALR